MDEEKKTTATEETKFKERAVDVSPNAIVRQEKIKYVSYTSEAQMPDVMKLMRADLSEPYSIYTYRYFIHNWPHLCVMVNVYYLVH